MLHNAKMLNADIQNSPANSLNESDCFFDINKLNICNDDKIWADSNVNEIPTSCTEIINLKQSTIIRICYKIASS